MLRMRIFLPVMIVMSTIAISCSDTADEANPQTATVTSTDTAPLIVPDGAPSASSTTIYDMWVLDSINGKAPDSGYFALGSPYFEFNAEKNTISGFTGCNGINGKINVKNQRVTFDSLIVSSQACRGKGKEFEKRLLTGFKSGKTTYTIQNEKLYLNLGTGSSIILRKIRR